MATTKVEALARAIPMKRWLLASVRLQCTSGDIMGDDGLLLMLVANEVKGKESGNFDNFSELLEMGLIDIAAIVDPAADDSDPEGDEADKSAPGVPATEGAGLHGDGAPLG